MALFFDHLWFDNQLAETKQSLEDVAHSLHLSVEQVKEIWKDQRELLPHEVGVLARMLGVTPAVIADHAGVSTPLPREIATADIATVLARLDEMSGRLERLERAMADLKILVLEQSHPPKE